MPIPAYFISYLVLRYGNFKVSRDRCFIDVSDEMTLPDIEAKRVCGSNISLHNLVMCKNCNLLNSPRILFYQKHENLIDIFNKIAFLYELFSFFIIAQGDKRENSKEMSLLRKQIPTAVFLTNFED